MFREPAKAQPHWLTRAEISGFLAVAGWLAFLTTFGNSTAATGSGSVAAARTIRQACTAHAARLRPRMCLEGAETLPPGSMGAETSGFLAAAVSTLQELLTD